MDNYFSRMDMRVNSLMWGDMQFPFIERNEVSNFTLPEIWSEVAEWSYIFNRLFSVRPSVDEIRLNDRLTSTLGRCTRRFGGFLLEFNPSFFKVCSAAHYHDIIAHELIHTLPGALNHGKKFKWYATTLGSVTKVHVTRQLYDQAHEEARAGVRKIEKEKYAIVCQKCGETVAYRTRNCKLVEHPDFYRCGRCRGELKVTVISST